MEACATDGVETVAVAQRARRASFALASAPRQQKDRALLAMVGRLGDRKREILAANQEDLDNAVAAGLPAKLIQRLRFGEEKIIARQRGLQKIAELPDPVGDVFHSERRPNGLEVARVRVPLGVVLMIYTHFVREFDRTMAARRSSERGIGAELKFLRFVCIAKRRLGSHMRGSKGGTASGAGSDGRRHRTANR